MASAAQNYPLPLEIDSDARFTFGLVLDVAEVLARHGYPPLSGDGLDHVDLGQALFRFLYRPS